MVKSEAENVVEPEIGGLVLVIQAFGGDEELAWSFRNRSNDMYAGATT